MHIHSEQLLKVSQHSINRSSSFMMCRKQHQPFIGITSGYHCQEAGDRKQKGDSRVSSLHPIGFVTRHYMGVIHFVQVYVWASQWLSSKESACKAGNTDSIPGLGRCPGERLGNPLQDSCLENLMDRGAWWTTVHGVAKSRTGLSHFHFIKNSRNT